MPTDVLKNIYNVVYQATVKHKNKVAVILAVIVTAFILISYHTSFLERLELLTLDYRFHVRPGQVRSSDVVFIDMAEDSINVIGRWPWPRKWHAALIKILSSYKPKAIAFDVVFSETQDQMDDTALDEAIRQSGVVYMPSVYDIDIEHSPTFYRGEGVEAIHEPLAIFKNVIKGTGHINAVPDSDGILRRAPPVIALNGHITYQLGIRVGADLLGVSPDGISFDPGRHNLSLRLVNGKIENVPLDRNNQLIINWVGKWGKDFKHYSYIDVIKSYAAIQEGDKPIIDLNEFRDKICIIGLTAIGLIDIKPIPIDSTYPAVGTNAMVISSILTGNFVREAPEWVNILILIIISMVATTALCNLRLLSGVIIAVAAIILYMLFSIILFIVFNISVITFYPMLAVAFAYVLTASYTQLLQSIERANLFKQATRDGLTQLYNVRHFNLLFEAEFRNVSTLKFRTLSIIMCDIDNFKRVNDTYGHQAGDTILREIAAVIQSKCRHMDVAGRYGGEEFIIMLSGANAVDAAALADKIRIAVSEKKFKFGDAVYSTTISLGVAEYYKEKVKNELIERADKALYESKHTGKNKVSVSPIEIN